MTTTPKSSRVRFLLGLVRASGRDGVDPGRLLKARPGGHAHAGPEPQGAGGAAKVKNKRAIRALAAVGLIRFDDGLQRYVPLPPAVDEDHLIDIAAQMSTAKMSAAAMRELIRSAPDRSSSGE